MVHHLYWGMRELESWRIVIWGPKSDCISIYYTMN